MGKLGNLPLQPPMNPFLTVQWGLLWWAASQRKGGKRYLITAETAEGIFLNHQLLRQVLFLFPVINLEKRKGREQWREQGSLAGDSSWKRKEKSEADPAWSPGRPNA